MLVDPDFYKEGDNAYYYSVPFVVSKVTPTFFVQSLVDLYDKILSGEPPALAYDEEWHKIETHVEREPEPEWESEIEHDESEHDE